MAQKKRIRRKLRRKAPPVRHAGPVQAGKSAASDLMIGGVLDPAERAAERMAGRALAGQAPGLAHAPASGGAVHRMCAECAAEEQEKPVKRAAAAAPVIASGAAAAAAPGPAARAVAARGAGRRMSRAERAFFEPRFAHDFSAVRIHEGPAAARATRALDARAFARRADIAFGSGERTREVMAHELAHVVQDDAVMHRAPLIRRACETCPNPVDPEVEATIQPIVSFGTPTGSTWGSTNWPTSAKGLGVSIWQRERNTCVKKNIGGKDVDVWEVCPRKINLRASVAMVIDKTEINRTSGGKRWWMECNAPAGKMLFDTEAAAKAAMTTPKKITVPGVIHHENYHVGVSKRVLEAAVKAQPGMTKEIAPYSADEIAKWKAGLEKTLNKFQEDTLLANPSEANEELNASTAECTQY